MPGPLKWARRKETVDARSACMATRGGGGAGHITPPGHAFEAVTRPKARAPPSAGHGGPRRREAQAAAITAATCGSRTILVQTGSGIASITAVATARAASMLGSRMRRRPRPVSTSETV